MAIHFNHTFLPARDRKASADFLAEMLGLPAPRRWGPFHMVTTDNDANLDYMDTEEKVVRQHYAFLVDDAEFEQIFNRIRARNCRAIRLLRRRPHAARNCGEVFERGKIYGFHEDVSDGDDRKHCMGVCRRMKQGGHFPGIMRTEVPCTRGP
jgi:hypothetical protein